VESWSWQLQGGPPVRLLQPFRTTRASRRARHIPATAFSVTNDDHVWLESGLEHDLLRKCDRDPDVEWIVSQPFRLSWTEPTFGSHIPDLLTLGASGQVTVWDARRLDEQDDDFRMHAEVASRCCSSVGWCHAVFGELTTIERVNLLWLHGFRRRPSWMDRYADLIWHTAYSPGTSLGNVFNLDDGSGELKSVVVPPTMSFWRTVPTSWRSRRTGPIETSTIWPLDDPVHGDIQNLDTDAPTCSSPRRPTTR